MSDHRIKVSVPVDAELLNLVSSASEKAAVPGATVTLQATSAQLEKLTKAREDMEDYQRRSVDAWRKGTDTFIKISEMRIAFFEKLILLSGGSFALSLSFLTSLNHRGPQSQLTAPLHALGRFKAAWVLLLACIVFSWLHNLHRASAVEHFVAATEHKVSSMQQTLASYLMTRCSGIFKGMESTESTISDAATITSKIFEGFSRSSQDNASLLSDSLKRYYRSSTALGTLALLSIVVAFVFMIVFAIENSTLL